MIRSFPRRIAAASLALAAVAAVPALAEAAPTRSFQAAKDGLASDTEVLASANLKTVRSTQLFSTFSSLATQDREVKEVLDAVKKSCSIDLMNAADDITVGVGPGDKGAIYLGVTGVTQDQFEKCVTTIAKQKSGETVTVKRTGNQMEFAHGSDKIFAAWLANNVLVLASDPENESLLKKNLAGGLAKNTKMMGRLGSVDTDAAAFFAWTRELPVQNGITTKGGGASLAYTSGNFALKLSVDLGDAEAASKLAKGASAAVGMFVPKDAPKEAQKILQSLQVKATGSVVDVALQAAESDLQKLIAWGKGGGSSSARKH
jgi:hypothetical protein